MLRRLVPIALALLTLSGCAGSAKLAQRGEERLASGENGRAWDLACRALDKDPGNVRARAVANTAGNAMARDWEQRIRALSQSDSVAAAEQVLQLCAFRVNAARYAALDVSPEQARAEQALRLAAARADYQHGVAELTARRPKHAYFDFTDAQRFVAEYRDAARLADKAYQRALDRVVVLPFAGSGGAALGRDVAASWRDDLAQRLAPPDAHFTRILGTSDVEQQMTVAQLSGLSRADAVRLGRKAGAERVVWGAVGDVEARTTLSLFTDRIARRVVEKHQDGSTETHWMDVPVEVVARVRTVTVPVDYEVIATREGATLAHQRLQRSTSARVVWTSFNPEGDLGDYALVSDVLRAADPDRASRVEAHWRQVCGEGTTLRAVLEARRSSRNAGHYAREALPRFMAGAAFVFLQDLPPAGDLAFAALAGGWQPLHADLVRLDGVDDVDLGTPTATDDVK